MRRIPQDVERLMWLVAENRDPKAIADFESRFPGFRDDLARHIEMVSRIKNARRLPPHEVPRFVPRYVDPPSPRRGLYVAFAFAAAALTFGTFAVTSWLGHRPTPAPRESTPIVFPSPTPPIVHKDPEPMTSKPESPATQAPPDSPASEDPLQSLVTIKVDRAPLEAAIAMVCKQAHIAYDPAPGLDDEEVSLDYESQPVALVLDDMGAKFGFTAIPQERGKLLIVPARRPGAAEPTESGPARRTDSLGIDSGH